LVKRLLPKEAEPPPDEPDSNNFDVRLDYEIGYLTPDSIAYFHQIFPGLTDEEIFALANDFDTTLRRRGLFKRIRKAIKGVLKGILNVRGSHAFLSFIGRD